MGEPASYEKEVQTLSAPETGDSLGDPTVVSTYPSWEDVPGSAERQPDSVVLVELSTFTSGTMHRYLSPGESVCDGKDEPLHVGVYALPAESDDEH
jgi:hypothetical protein